MAGEFKKVENWAPVEGIWETGPDSVVYSGSKGTATFRGADFQRGIVLSGVRFTNGKIRTEITLPPKAAAGHILLGFSSSDSRYITAGIGGYEEAYTIAEFVPRVGLRQLKGAGLIDNLMRNYPYRVEVEVDGQRITLNVDGIRVLSHILSEPLAREQVGLFALGNETMSFGPVEFSTSAPSAFVVMQFTPQFDALFEEVIRPVCAEMGVVAYRASDIYRPGVIIQDITQGLAASNVIISEVTPANPNVFYELGYAHALQKPAILLADRDTTLPFDISGHRVIFYDNTIGGKSALETGLRQHLTNILR